jgi:hypothetical protein
VATHEVLPDKVQNIAPYVRHEGHCRGLLRESPPITDWTVETKGKTYPGFDTPGALVTAEDIAVVE